MDVKIDIPEWLKIPLHILLPALWIFGCIGYRCSKRDACTVTTRFDVCFRTIESYRWYAHCFNL